MKSAVIGFPRVGKLKELKFTSEKYFRGEITEEELEQVGKELRKEHWQLQKYAGVNYISSNDFSFYDGMLDAAILLNAIPEGYRRLGLNEHKTYFSMARGYQGKQGDVKAFVMKKWFNTNYHYMVPELDDDTKIKLSGSKPFNEYEESKSLGIETKPAIMGAFTFLKLAKYNGMKVADDYLEQISKAYVDVLERMNELGAKWVQFDEWC